MSLIKKKVEYKTRNLTTEEIEDILSFIVPNKRLPYDTSIVFVEKNKNMLRDQLKTQKIFPNMIPDLKIMLEKQYMTTLISAGESVGILAAQSIGEKNTQSTLNTFHKAGSGEKTVTTGVPRLEELLNATAEPRSVICCVYTKNHHNSIAELRDTIQHSVIELTLNTLSKSYNIVKNKKHEKWYESFKILHEIDFTKYTDCISVKLDINLMYEHRLKMEDISDVITKEYDDLLCVYSPDNIGQLDIFVDTTNINLPENRLVFINTENAIEIYLEEVVQPIIFDIIVCGIPGIKNIYYQSNPNCFEVDGSNFRKLLGLPFSDSTRVMSNNMWDIYRNLGIEATREFLINEFMLNMEGINICHPQLLSDRMTHNGGISSISRYTMRHDESGPFGKASFEESVDNFIRAAAVGQEESTDGVSASIICGKMAKMGTGVFGLKIDINKLPSCEHKNDDENDGDDKKDSTILLTTVKEKNNLTSATQSVVTVKDIEKKERNLHSRLKKRREEDIDEADDEDEDKPKPPKKSAKNNKKDMQNNDNNNQSYLDF